MGHGASETGQQVKHGVQEAATSVKDAAKARIRTTHGGNERANERSQPQPKSALSHLSWMCASLLLRMRLAKCSIKRDSRRDFPVCRRDSALLSWPSPWIASTRVDPPFAFPTRLSNTLSSRRRLPSRRPVRASHV